MKIEAQIRVDEATPLLQQVLRVLDDPTPLNKAIATRAEILTRNHLRGLNRHATAQRLGAAPTGYFQRKAEGVESFGTREMGVVTIPTGENSQGEPGLEAFARVFGPVTIRAVRAKFLTIPATAAAYGRRAGEFDFLKFIPLRGERGMLARVEGKGKNRKAQVFYWLTKSVELSADRSLLPGDQEYLDAAEQGAVDLMESL